MTDFSGLPFVQLCLKEAGIRIHHPMYLSFLPLQLRSNLLKLNRRVSRLKDSNHKYQVESSDWGKAHRPLQSYGQRRFNGHVAGREARVQLKGSPVFCPCSVYLGWRGFQHGGIATSVIAPTAIIRFLKRTVIK